MKVGITERGDASTNLKWMPWVESGKPAILITKNPVKLYDKVKKENNIIIHCTITGNGGTIMEPHVIPYVEALDGYYRLVDVFGRNRIVLRIDPIIPVEEYLSNSFQVLNLARKTLGNNMTRIRISFVDNYPHVKERMMKLGMTPFSFGFDAPLEKRIDIWRQMGCPSICGENGMPSTGCISKFDCDVLGVNPEHQISKQRSSCACLGNKYELLNSPERCQHKCVYCFWKNDSKTKLF